MLPEVEIFEGEEPAQIPWSELTVPATLGVLTVKIATLLVIAPAFSKQRYWFPFDANANPVKDKVAEVSPDMSAQVEPLFVDTCH